MKRYFTACISAHWVRAALILGLASLSGYLNAAEWKNGTVVTRVVRGEVQYKTEAAGKWKPLKQGTKLVPGAIIETAQLASVDLYLPDIPSVIRVTGFTQLALDKLAFTKVDEDRLVEVKLDLRAGKILGNVKKLAEGSVYEVKFPNGKCTIQGTEFMIRADGIVWVVSGTAKVTYTFPGGKTFTSQVNVGQQYLPPKTVSEEPRVEPIPPVDFPGDPNPPVSIPLPPTPEPITKPPSQPENRPPAHPTGVPQPR